MIDYQKFGKAQRYYQDKGYNYLEVPWITSKEAIYATKLTSPNKDSKDYTTLTGYLVASGEQSFIQLILENKLPVGKSFCITPCFRDETTNTDIIKEYFLKLELIHYMDFKEYDLLGMVHDVIKFFSYYMNEDKISLVKTSIGYDIEVEGIELGSYGMREYKEYKWIYGTGLADPRFSYVRKLYNSKDD